MTNNDYCDNLILEKKQKEMEHAREYEEMYSLAEMYNKADNHQEKQHQIEEINP